MSNFNEKVKTYLVIEWENLIKLCKVSEGNNANHY